MNMLKGENTKIHESLFLPHLVAYTSAEAHSAVEKAAKICIIRLRKLPVDERGVLRGDVLEQAIEHDVNVEGFTPIFVYKILKKVIFFKNILYVIIDQQQSALLAHVHSIPLTRSVECVKSIKQFGSMSSYINNNNFHECICNT